MITGTKLKSFKNLTNHKKFVVYNKPKYVYIPLMNGRDTNVTVLVKKDEYVYKGTPVGRTKGKFKIPVLSSVSGQVLGFANRTSLNGHEVKCVVIENDLKEKTLPNNNVVKEIGKMDRNQFLNTLRDCGIIGMGGSGFPTYVKYNPTKKIKTLIINAVECEPYITADYVLFEEKCEEILEAIDAIMEINNIPEGFIAIKKTNVKLIKKLNNFLGTYIKIKVIEVPNLYPMGWEKSLVKYIKHTDYRQLPIEKGIVVNNVSTIYAIYEALKYERPLTERIVTLTGEMLKKPQNVLVKIGTPIDEVVASIDGYKRNKDITFVAGGPMMGISLPSDDLIVSGNLNCVLVLKDEPETKAMQCLRCGKCVAHCPAKLAPVLIKDAISQPEKLKGLEPHRCVECGLCSYICPSKIKVCEYVRRAKEIRGKEENKNG